MAILKNTEKAKCHFNFDLQKMRLRMRIISNAQKPFKNNI